MDEQENKTVVNALAVASEPYIFWRGEDAESIIEQISIPKEVGKLLPANQELNGPSGKALDDLILNPLGLERQKSWCCDLVPYSCVNPSQSKAIERAYLQIAQQYGLANPSVPSLPNPLIDDQRRTEIVDELLESKARVLILLGDLPIKWFLSYFDDSWKKLGDFGRDIQSYGQLHNSYIGNKEMTVLPLAHPRQIAKLGQSSVLWHDIHGTWLEKSARSVAQSIKPAD